MILKYFRLFRNKNPELDTFLILKLNLTTTTKKNLIFKWMSSVPTRKTYLHCSKSKKDLKHSASWNAVDSLCLHSPRVDSSHLPGFCFWYYRCFTRLVPLWCHCANLINHKEESFKHPQNFSSICQTDKRFAQKAPPSSVPIASSSHFYDQSTVVVNW